VWEPVDASAIADNGAAPWDDVTTNPAVGNPDDCANGDNCPRDDDADNGARIDNFGSRQGTPGHHHTGPANHGNSDNRRCDFAAVGHIGLNSDRCHRARSGNPAANDA
jgi:hypothetical protein